MSLNEYKKIYKKKVGEEFPQDPMKQLEYAINAVFDSWQTPRAVTYRILNKITGLIGTAVNVQTMVFGNMGEDCATGVCFTRNPSNGDNHFYGEFLVNAQGEDVVAGIRMTKDISQLRDEMPAAYKEFKEIAERLEKHYREMQDVEFTIEKEKLWMLQTRDGKRTAQFEHPLLITDDGPEILTTPTSTEGHPYWELSPTDPDAEGVLRQQHQVSRARSFGRRGRARR